MQVMFLVLFVASLVLFSLFVREAVQLVPYLLAGDPLPVAHLIRGAVWGILFLVGFFGTGLFLYERERDEGRIGRRIRIYDWFLDRRKHDDAADCARAKPIRRE